MKENVSQRGLSLQLAARLSGFVSVLFSAGELGGRVPVVGK
jgi:hypothetical protein